MTNTCLCIEQSVPPSYTRGMEKGHSMPHPVNIQ